MADQVQKTEMEKNVDEFNKLKNPVEEMKEAATNWSPEVTDELFAPIKKHVNRPPKEPEVTYPSNMQAALDFGKAGITKDQLTLLVKRVTEGVCRQLVINPNQTLADTLSGQIKDNLRGLKKDVPALRKDVDELQVKMQKLDRPDVQYSQIQMRLDTLEHQIKDLADLITTRDKMQLVRMESASDQLNYNLENSEYVAITMPKQAEQAASQSTPIIAMNLTVPAAATGNKLKKMRKR